MKSFSPGQSWRLLFTLLLPVCCCAQFAAATTIHSKQSGAWSATSTWQNNVVPTAADYVIIDDGHTVVNSNPLTRNALVDVYGSLVLTGNTVRTFNASSSLNIYGIVIIESGTTYLNCITYGSGTFRQTGGSTYFDKYYINTTDLLGGSAYFYGPLDLNFPNLTLKNALMDGTQDMAVSGYMLWGNNGILDNDSKLIIQSGASLDLEAGGIWQNSGTLYNYGTVHGYYGMMKNHNAYGSIGNNGIWLFETAGQATTFTNQNFINNEQATKQGSGSVSFVAASRFSQSAGSAAFYLQQGTFNTPEVGSLAQAGLWQIDAGATLNYTPNPNVNYPFVYYYGDKIINNGQIKGTRWIVVGNDETVLEGNGKYEKLGIDKSGANVSLAGSPEITVELLLSGGLLVLNQYDLRMGNALLAPVSGGSYMETNGTGSCIRYCPANIPTEFPIGQEGYAPVFMTVAAGSQADHFRVRTIHSFDGEYNGTTSLCSESVGTGVVSRTWVINEGIPGGTTAQVGVSWDGADEQSGFDRGACTLGRYVNGDWQANGFSSVGAAPFLQTASQSAFGLFGVFDTNHLADVNFITPVPTSEAPVCAGSDLQLYANTSPHATVQWTGPGFTSNEYDPMAPQVQVFGNHTYTVEAEQYGCPAKQGSITVQVNALPAPVITGPTSIQSGQTATLTASGGVSFHWSTGANTASVSVSPIQNTAYQVTVTNQAGCTASIEHQVTVQGLSTATEATAVLQHVTLAPNPTTDVTTLTFDSATDGDAQLLLSDLRGVQLQRNIPIVKGSNTIDLFLHAFPAGVYQISIRQGNAVQTLGVVKI